MAEMRRVLRPGGDLLFIEHGRAPDPCVIHFQDWLTPAQPPLARGSHLNLPIADLITAAGFRMDNLRTGYAPGLKPPHFPVRMACARRLKGAVGRAAQEEVEDPIGWGRAVALMSPSRSDERLKTRRSPPC